MEKQLSDKLKVVEQGTSASIVYTSLDGTQKSLVFDPSGISFSAQVSSYFYFSGGNIRIGERSGNFVVDKTITALGFAGTEDVDWENIGGAGV
jgi:hypothetical protein